MANPRETAKKLVQEWSTQFGPRLRSALLFGSVTRGEAIEGVSDINILLLLDRIDTGTLRQASPSVRNWVKTALEAPLLFAADQWVRAADVFAIEIADMRDAHEVLHGSDPLEDLHVDVAAMRHQAERELRAKLLQLQTGLLVAAHTPEDVGRLLMQSIPSFTTYMRTVLRLAGQPVPPTTPAVIDAACALVNGKADAYRQVWDARAGRRSFKVDVGGGLVDDYYGTAEKLADYVDTFRR